MTWWFNRMNANYYGRLYGNGLNKDMVHQDLPEVDIPDEVLAILLGIKEGGASYGDDD